MLTPKKDRIYYAFKAWLVVSAVLAALPVYLAIQHWRFAHWLNADAVQTSGIVTAYDGLLLKYSYRVNGWDYTGRVKTPGQYEVGGKLDVFISASHPSMCSTRQPPLPFEPAGYVAVVIASSSCVFLVMLMSLRDEKSA